MNRSFSRRTVLIVATLFGLSILVGAGLAVFQEELSVSRSSGPDSFSYSALGHRGFKTLLQELGYQVLTSRNNSGDKASQGDLLVLAEPNLAIQRATRVTMMRTMCDEANSVLIVLPKRQGVVDPYHLNHLGSVSKLPAENAELVLLALGLEDSLTTHGHSRNQNWTAGIWHDQPFIDDLQLLKTNKLKPILSCSKGVLFGELISDEAYNLEYWFYGTIYILTDPDLLANHGLHQGNNAAIMAKIIDFTTEENSGIVFDETLHGHEVSPSMFRAFFRVPLVFLLIQVLLTAGAFMWLATGRFGSPVAPATKTGAGLGFLINNTAELLDYGDHGPYVLAQYFQSSTHDVCRRLHLELPAKSPAAKKRLLNISKKRSPDFDYDNTAAIISDAAIENRLKPQQTLKLARAVHRWQQEMTHG